VARAARQQAYDAIVVGSGITGGWAAKELCERGLRTLVLEAGRPIDPATDYVEHIPPWQARYRGLGDRRALERHQPVQRHCYACDEHAAKFFVNDLDNPYTTEPGRPFRWIRGRQVGGRSLMWARQVYRWSDLDFEANAREGVGIDWPIRYADIEPWYDRVERFIGISGRAEGLPQLPDGRFLPPMTMNCAEESVRDAVARTWGRERVMTIGRCAILTQPHNGRAACHYCGPCHRGCVTHSYFSSNGSTLPAAATTGRLTLRPHSVVHSVIYDSARDRATGVRVIDGETMRHLEFHARIVFLCASAFESTRILMNSASDRFPDGLGNSSDQLGRNVMDHVFETGARATIPGHERVRTRGTRPNGIYVPRFRNVNRRTPGFLRGYGFQGEASQAGWTRGGDTTGFGAAFKRGLIADPGPWSMVLEGFGECLPRPDNRMTLDPAVVDRWGIPAVRFDVTWGPNEAALKRDIQITASELFEAAGARDIAPFDNEAAPGFSIHEMGTARMGRDPNTSVLNGANQLWDCPNVFVTDGACMASSACQNPSITYMALTARAAAHAVDLLNRKEL
jgi:choline dehydrogenase-like flavoprotein